LGWPARCTPSGRRGVPLPRPIPRVSTTAWRVTVVEECDAVGVLVRRVETAPLVTDWRRSQAER